jgi:hypothetical protein
MEAKPFKPFQRVRLRGFIGPILSRLGWFGNLFMIGFWTAVGRAPLL